MLLAAVLSVAVAQTPEVITLSNGMRWVLLSRPDSGLVSGMVTVRAGGVHEREGATGVAHLLEHLAFAGTPIVGPKRSWRLEAPMHDQVLNLTHELAQRLRERAPAQEVMILETELIPLDEEWRRRGDASAFHELMSRNGVQINAWTSKDTTAYWGEFPQEQLHLWLAAEAQRFAAPVFRDFRNERDVVIQELRDRQTVLSSGLDALIEMAFEGSGYAWSVGGREADLRAMSPRSLDVFYERLYSPENAVGALVGEFDPKQARTWLEETFALIPRREVERPARVAFTTPRWRQVAANERWVLLGFETPAELTDEHSPSELLQYLLAEEDGVLTRVVKESGGEVTAASVQTGPGVYAPHLTIVALQLSRRADAATVHAKFFKLLSAWTPSDEDVVRARAALERQRLQRQRSRRLLSEELATRVLFRGDPTDLNAERLKTTSTAEVVEAARAFTANKAWVVELIAP